MTVSGATMQYGSGSVSTTRKGNRIVRKAWIWAWSDMMYLWTRQHAFLPWWWRCLPYEWACMPPGNTVSSRRQRDFRPSLLLYRRSGEHGRAFRTWHQDRETQTQHHQDGASGCSSLHDSCGFSRWKQCHLKEQCKPSPFSSFLLKEQCLPWRAEAHPFSPTVENKKTKQKKTHQIWGQKINAASFQNNLGQCHNRIIIIDSLLDEQPVGLILALQNRRSCVIFPVIWIWSISNIWQSTTKSDRHSRHKLKKKKKKHSKSNEE